METLRDVPLVQFMVWESWDQLYSAIAGLSANPPPAA